MKRLTVIVVVAIVAAACSSSSDSDVATTSTTNTASADTSSTLVSSAGVESSTTTVTAAPTTTVAVASDVSSCVVGEWEMDSQQFFDDVFASLPAALPADEAIGEFTYASGAYVLLIGADGTFSSERREWTFQVASEDGDLEMTVDGAEAGTYTLVGGQLTTVTETTAPLAISMAIDGVPFEFPTGFAPVTPPNAEFSGATVTCEGDVLTASAEGFQSIWYRSG